MFDLLLINPHQYVSIFFNTSDELFDFPNEVQFNELKFIVTNNIDKPLTSMTMVNDHKIILVFAHIY